jgi:SAM-dependent methyltransferase
MPDLITIPGIPELWTHTKGDSRIKIAILDGAADLDRACFKGAKITQFKPYWAEDIELNDEYYHYLKLATEFNQQQKAKKEDPDHDKEEAKKEREAFFKDFPEDIKRRIDLSSHATHISSTILGQHGSPVEGIAPNCTAINIPISFAGDDFISFVNLTHAINEALKAEVNIVHIAACHPTQSGMAQEIFARAVKQCQDSNILIVAPGGNDKGECWCIPSILPDVLTVGAMRDDGQPFKFSNYGGDYQHKGVMANGENILGANPGTDIPVREKGTSCAAPIVTGISALLMSMQLQRGEKPNAEAVRQAILKSAIPCDQNEVEEPERCLLGKLNIPGAYNLLTGENLLVTQQTFKDNSQHRQKVQDYYNTMNQIIVEDVGTTYQAGLLNIDTEDIDVAARATNLYLAERAGIKPGDYVLDAGCGAGGPAIDIAQNIPNVKIEGITISKEQANTAQKLIQQARLEDRIHLQVGDYHNLPFADAVFDVVYFFESFEYAYDHLRLFTEVYRVLRQGGTLYLKGVFAKELPMSEQQKQELAEFDQIYACRIIPLSQMAVEIQLANFEQLELHDLSKIVTTEKFTKAMLNSPNEDQSLTNFGKFHFREFQNLPIFFGEIKARKPVAVSSVTQNIALSSSEISTKVSNLATTITASQPTNGITASAASKLVYILGNIGYDFGSEARRDSFKQLMSAVEIDGTTIPANPYNASQIVNYLAENPSESKSLIWTINQELNPIYALEIKGGFAADVYEMMNLMLAGQIEPESSDDYVERVSIPGQITDKTITLFSGQEVPVITINNIRGMYGWKVNGLVDAALQTLSEELADANEIQMRRSLSSFLKRVYFDLQNLGKTSKDRALNFAATNAFQAASSFAQAVSTGMELDTIEIEKSPFCRVNSDCWDVKLKFFDPERGLRAKKVYLFSIDVSYMIPVTLGQVRSWSVPK